MMPRLLGLLACVFLAFVFPLYAYQINSGIIFDAVISTSVFSAITVAVFSGRNDQVC